MDRREGIKTIAACVIHQSDTPEQTEALAAGLAQNLRGGECIALDGPLGAGKTQFVRGLLRGLGGRSNSVNSPTYVLLNVYEGGRLPVFHLDAYRVQGADDFEAIGFGELLEQRGVVVVEWAQRIAELLPANRISIVIDPIDERRRQIQVTLPG
ncbi:MAG TPA: tRNA (adenosine(37)-N6)-threonylcarbamoyltransferase complex ATPase subunit type 1 TsaE [Humisphaera sp.]|nr:tRNA (adenosine(37)-N6)-threonylcarbamoyltransferase complex ATPase subunit type 1 TsaE [Humisphaera sp.]